MKIAYNPSGASPLAGAPENNNDIIFDLAGKAIYVKDVKLLGTDTVYDVFKKHTSSSGGGNVGLVPVPSYTNTNTRFLREDGTWVIPTDNKVLQGVSSNSKFRCLLLGSSQYESQPSTPSEVTGQAYITKNIYVDPSKATLYADTFVGKLTYTNLTGSTTTANQAIVSNGTANGWTLKTLGSNAFDSTAYLPLSGGTLSGDLNFRHLNASVKGYITWTGGTILQRIQISDNVSTNDAVFTFQQSTNSGTDWTDLFTIKDNGSVTATTFQGNLDGTYVNKLTGYSKATAAADLAATDTLNAALGKLEYKADTTYDWYKSITDTDTDDVVNKWGEIVDFIDSVKEGTDVLDEFVTRKTSQIIAGQKNFNTSANTLPLLISRSGNNTEEVLKIGVNDNQATFEYVNDKVSNYFVFKLVNTDTEGSDGSKANSSYVRFRGDADGSTITANKFIGNLDKTLTFAAGAFTAKTYNNSTAVTVNIPTHTSHLTNNSGFLTQHQSLANYVTLDTDQTITGAKTFKRIIYGNAYNYNENKAGAYLVLNKGGNYLGIGASSSNIQTIVIGESDLSGTWIKEHVTIDTSGYVNATKFIGISKSGPRYLGRDYAAFKTTGYSGGCSPTLSIKTTNGSWELGTYDDSYFINNLIFNYVTDTDYNSGTNQNVTIKLPYTKSGTIALTSDITKATVGLGNVQNTAFYARTATVNGADYAIAGTKSGATFSIYSPTTVGTYGQVLVSTGSGAPSWVNQSSLSTKWNGSADWTAVTTVNQWSRILTINSSKCNVILSTTWSQSSQASAHLYLISIGYQTAKIIQLGCGEYKHNYAIKIRITCESGPAYHIEVFNDYNYYDTTTISVPCRIINCSNNCSFTTIDTYTPGGGTVKSELTSHYHIAKNLHSEWSSNGIFYIEGTGTTAGTWLGSHAEILSYYAGLTIAYKIPVAGASTTTLNINGLGAKTCYYNNHNLTTHYPKNTTVILVYDGTNFVVADYNYTRTDVRQYLTDSTNSEYPLLFRYNTEAPTSNGYITEYTRYASAITVNPSTNTITTNIKGNIAPLEKLTTTQYTTSKAVKDKLASLFSNINTGIGANVIIPAKAVEYWNSETTALTDSSLYDMIKIGGGYFGATYGQWLLSSYSNSRIGYVGRNASTWGDIHWLATTKDIDSLKNYYWANIKISSSANSSTSPTFANATISGVTNTNTLTISNTSDVGHINFSRGSYNYITMPSNGLLHILPNGVRVSARNGMVFSANGLHPATSQAYDLGTSSLKWGQVHASELLSTICKSTQIELNLAGGLSNYGGFIDFHFHNSDGKPTDNQGNVVETTPNYTSRIIENAAGTLYINGTTFKNGYVTSAGFVKSGSSDSYILLGGGSHKAVSEFLLKSELANQELNSNITTIEKSLKVTKDWMDTGIKSTDIPANGSYVVQVYLSASTDAFYSCYWTGLMSWYSDTVNDTESDEILLHRAGHAYNNTIYLRTKMTGSINYSGTGEGLKLQIAANKDLSAAYTFKFKFKRVI